MKKKILAMILAFAMIASVLSIPVFADTEETDHAHAHAEETACTHENGTWVSDLKQSDCATDTHGIAKYWCDDCDTNYYVQLPVHNTVWVTTQEATCHTAGSKVQICLTCDETISDAVEIPATGAHTWAEKETTVDATCTEPAKVYIPCTVCDAIKEGSAT
ncbi:MAG: hypothetical protein IJX80_03350, partial [Clostridia bacterium]|nr:hypothetical protein [Clostridia bacterium]